MMNEKYTTEVLEMLFQDARRQFGDSIRGHWFYGEPDCPGCGFEVDALENNGERLFSINAFIHRKPGILIGYFLCSRCLATLQSAMHVGPFTRLPLHANIEAALVAGYEAYLQKLDA